MTYIVILISFQTIYSILTTITGLLEYDKFGSNFVLIKNSPYSIILPPKNGRFKTLDKGSASANNFVHILAMHLLVLVVAMLDGFESHKSC